MSHRRDSLVMTRMRLPISRAVAKPCSPRPHCARRQGARWGLTRDEAANARSQALSTLNPPPPPPARTHQHHGVVPARLLQEPHDRRGARHLVRAHLPAPDSELLHIACVLLAVQGLQVPWLLHGEEGAVQIPRRGAAGAAGSERRRELTNAGILSRGTVLDCPSFATPPGA